jgi:hypothetical protein
MSTILLDVESYLPFLSLVCAPFSLVYSAAVSSITAVVSSCSGADLSLKSDPKKKAATAERKNASAVAAISSKTRTQAGVPGLIESGSSPLLP